MRKIFNRSLKIKNNSILNLTSLKDKVYEYLRHQMKIGKIRPDSLINLDSTSKKLGISRTPLREALIQLEIEGFVTILPRRGVIVNKLTLQGIKNIYQLIGSLESTAIISIKDSISQSDLRKMKKLNESMKKAIVELPIEKKRGKVL